MSPYMFKLLISSMDISDDDECCIPPLSPRRAKTYGGPNIHAEGGDIDSQAEQG